MALMIAEVYDAFRAANVPEDQARKAAEALAAYQQPTLKSDVRLVKWMVGFNLAVSVATLLKLLR